MTDPQLTAGVDEAGRGPLAGPVVAAAVILDPRRAVPGIADSKTLSAARRSRLAELIMRDARAYALGIADVGEIDELNILWASMLAMRRAVSALHIQPNRVLVDGNRCPADMPCDCQAIIKGDASVESIGAASILAKVHRDRMMDELHRSYPDYGFNRHRGYPTRDHVAALETHGVTSAHRRSFRPVARVLALRIEP